MKITIRVTPCASENKIAMKSDGSFAARVTTAPTDGKSNVAVAKLIAKYFNISQSHIHLRSGANNRTKILQSNKLNHALSNGL